jgi:hypothetical protein
MLTEAALVSFASCFKRSKQSCMTQTDQDHAAVMITDMFVFGAKCKL